MAVDQKHASIHDACLLRKVILHQYAKMADPLMTVIILVLALIIATATVSLCCLVACYKYQAWTEEKLRCDLAA